MRMSIRVEIIQMSINTRISKMQYKHKMEYYTATKNELQLHANT